MQIKGILLILILFLCIGINAESMYIAINDDIYQYELSDISYIDFTDVSIPNADTMCVVINEDTYQYELSEISYIDFTNVSIDDLEELFSKIPVELMQNYPNPFKPQTTSTVINFDLKKTGFTDVSIYNIKGQKIKTLSKENMQIGTHSILWDGKDNNGKTVTSGIYLYSVTQNDNRITKKMIIIK